MKQLILMKGLPGSGKSVWARNFADLIGRDQVDVFSADHFFTRNGKYKYRPNLLGLAHKICYKNVRDSLMMGIPYVIVDNCNLRARDRKPYIEIANEFGYELVIVEPPTEWKDNPEECFNKTIHGVPLESIQRMQARRS